MPLFGPPSVDKLKAKRDVKTLIELLCSSKDRRIRCEAAAALGDIGDPRAVEGLEAGLAPPGLAGLGLGMHRSAEVRSAIVNALRKAGGPAPFGILRVLTFNHDFPDQWPAADIVNGLCELDPAGAAALFVTHLSPGSRARDVADEALLRLGQAAVEPLKAALDDEKAGRAAAELLYKIGWQPAPDEIGTLFCVRRRDWAGCANIGHAAVEPLIRQLEGSDPDICDGVARTLGRIRDPRAVEPLIEKLRRPNYESTKRAAASALGDIGGAAAVAALIQVLQDDRLAMPYRNAGVDRWVPLDDCKGVRTEAGKALGRRGREAIGPLIECLMEGDDTARASAADALAYVGRLAVDPLVGVMCSGNPKPAEAAARALEKLQWAPASDQTGAHYWITRKRWTDCAAIGEAAVEPLLGALERAASKGDDKSVQEIAEVLGLMGDCRAIPALTRLLNHRAAARAAAEALECLGWVPEPGGQSVAYMVARRNWQGCAALGAVALDPLLGLLKDGEPEAQAGAAEALGRLGDRRALPPLLAALRSKAGSVRRAAAVALDRLAGAPSTGEDAAAYCVARQDWNRAVKMGETAVGPLANALQDPDADIRTHCAEALGGTRSTNALEPLMAALQDWDAGVRRAACEALGRLARIHGRSAVEPLLAALAEGDYGGDRGLKNFQAALVECGAVAVRPLLDALGSGKLRLECLGFDVVDQIGAPGVDPLIALLKDPVFANRRRAALMLVSIYKKNPDPATKKKILAQRETIQGGRSYRTEHNDGYTTGQCYRHYDEQVQVTDGGIEVDFRL
jgi:HEAT repeat protein